MIRTRIFFEGPHVTSPHLKRKERHHARPHTSGPITPAPLAQPALAPGPPQMKITASQAETVASWIKDDLAKGKITLEQAAKAFDDMNTPMEQRAPDSRSDEEKILDKQFPPAKDSDFTIRYGLPGEDVVMTPELKQFDSAARTWMSGAGLPRELGNSLVNTIAKVAQTTKDMTPAQLDDYSTREYAKLGKAFVSTLDDKLRAAGHMVEALDTKPPV